MILAMSTPANSKASPSRSLPEQTRDSFFARAANREEASTRMPEEKRARLPRGPSIEIGIELSPTVDRVLRRGAAAVGLTPESLLSRMVTRLCREVEAEENGLPAFLQTRSPAVAPDPEATTVFRRITLRQAEKRCLRRTSARLECSPSALVAHRVVYIRNEIDVDLGDGESSDGDNPLAAYRRLLAVLYPKASRRMS